jgi:hypothetical protein
MNTNWSKPKTNLIAAINDLRKCIAFGYKARLVREYNENCIYPIKEKKYITDFRCYEFMTEHSSTVNKIINVLSLNDVEKQLTLNYVNCYGSEEAVKNYYETGALSAGNFKSAGRSHLVNVDDLIEYMREIEEEDRAKFYENIYRNPNNRDFVHFFDIFILKNGYNNYWTIKKFNRKLWVVELLDKKALQSKFSLTMKIIMSVFSFVAKLLKYIPEKSVFNTSKYKSYTFRIGSVINGLSIEIHIPKNFSFRN